MNTSYQPIRDVPLKMFFSLIWYMKETLCPANSHFDTTKGHIEGRHAIALDCTIDAAKQTQLEIPFKGNVDPDKLQKALTEYAERIPFIIVTITNNTAGGTTRLYAKPVRSTCHRRQIWQNPYFSTLHVLPRMPTSSKCAKKVTETKTIKEITREMFSLADGMTMSAKKDGIVNMGGFIATRRADW